MTVTWVRRVLFISSLEAWDLALSKLPIKDDCEEVVWNVVPEKRGQKITETSWILESFEDGIGFA